MMGFIYAVLLYWDAVSGFLDRILVHVQHDTREQSLALARSCRAAARRGAFAVRLTTGLYNRDGRNGVHIRNDLEVESCCWSFWFSEEFVSESASFYTSTLHRYHTLFPRSVVPARLARLKASHEACPVNNQWTVERYPISSIICAKSANDRRHIWY
ncbi:hypothetical protein B0H34DRAFT_693303 [Crassisporium funariophilum]|nr:hypothetical protein B0H34DRAFT_693303 [Crassisporium funariophilum]